MGDFPGGPVVKNLPSNAGDASSNPGWETKIPHAVGSTEPMCSNYWACVLKALTPQLQPTTGEKPPWHNQDPEKPKEGKGRKREKGVVWSKGGRCSLTPVYLASNYPADKTAYVHLDTQTRIFCAPQATSYWGLQQQKPVSNIKVQDRRLCRQINVDQRDGIVHSCENGVSSMYFYAGITSKIALRGKKHLKNIAC